MLGAVVLDHMEAEILGRGDNAGDGHLATAGQSLETQNPGKLLSDADDRRSCALLEANKSDRMLRPTTSVFILPPSGPRTLNIDLPCSFVSICVSRRALLAQPGRTSLPEEISTVSKIDAMLSGA
jgi:hypothetical protein